jgi:hypothetical protein
MPKCLQNVQESGHNQSSIVAISPPHNALPIVNAFNPFSTLRQLIGKKEFCTLPLRAASFAAQKEYNT